MFKFLRAKRNAYMCGDIRNLKTGSFMAILKANKLGFS